MPDRAAPFDRIVTGKGVLPPEELRSLFQTLQSAPAEKGQLVLAVMRRSYPFAADNITRRMLLRWKRLGLIERRGRHWRVTSMGAELDTYTL